jgi:hypothetical protein
LTPTATARDVDEAAVIRTHAAIVRGDPLAGDDAVERYCVDPLNR